MSSSNEQETVKMGVYEIGNFLPEFKKAKDYMQDITNNPCYPSELPIGKWFLENFEACIGDHHLYLRDKGNVRTGEEIKPDGNKYARIGNDLLMVSTILQVSVSLYRANRIARE